MKSISVKLIFAFIGMFLLSGCAGDNVVSHSIIQKRKYTGGFHFWATGKATTDKKNSTIKIEFVMEDTVKNTAKKVVVLPVSNNQDSGIHEKKLENTETNPSEVKTDLLKEKLNENDNSNPLSNTKPEVRNNRLGVVSAVMGVAGLILFFSQSVGLGVALSIFAMLFGFIAFMRIRRRPDEYTGKGYAIVGYASGCLVIGLVTLGLIFVTLFPWL